MDTFVCQRCGQELPRARLKEVVYEQDRERFIEEVCPSCLDKAMNESGKVRGVVGREKAAAARLTDGSGGERKSLGGRG